MRDKKSLPAQSCIELEKDNHDIATLWLNRPEKGNALSQPMIDEIIQTLQQLNDCRVLLLRARGKNFCAGADLEYMLSAGDANGDDNLREAERLALMFQLLNELPVPVIAEAKGGIYGGGIGLLCCADLVLGLDPSTIRLCFSEVKLGLVPAVISPYVLSAIGTRQARRYLLSAEAINFDQAQQLGLIHRAACENEIATIALNYLDNAPGALATCKGLIRNSEYTPDNWHRQLCQLIAQLRASDEGREGLNAFLQKRKPYWSHHPSSNHL